MSTSADLRRIVGAMTGVKWTYNRELAWLHAEDPDDGEIYTIANLHLDSTPDGKCYGASRNGQAIAALANHADALVALVEACEEIRPRLDHELHGAISGRHAEQIGRLLLALTAVHAVPRW